jgi:cobalt-zinc-cadmium efflux system protein
MAHDHAAHAHDHHDDPDHDHSHDHGHAHGRDQSGHSHSHDHAHSSSETRIAIAAILTGAFMGVELVGALIAGSLALIADAGHMLSDFASLALAWVGFRIARRPADATRTFGFTRFSVLAAFVNGIALVAVTIWIAIEAVMRLMTPQHVQATTMLWVAGAGLAVNLISFAVLHGGDRDNLNIRGALLHVAGDLFGSVAAMIAAAIIMATGWMAADPILSIVVALIILRSAWALISDAGHILLEGAPRHLDIAAVSKDLSENIAGVIDVHHAHAWSLDEKRSMMTLHARIADGVSGPETVARIKQRLAARHRVSHATVEIEHDDCAGPDCA